jgi:hypothetical protein
LNNCNWKREETLVLNSWKTIYPSTLVGMIEFDLFAFESIIAFLLMSTWNVDNNSICDG